LTEQQITETKLDIEDYSIAKQVFKVVILLFCAYFLSLEIIQMGLQGVGTYLKSPWNYLDTVPPLVIAFSLLSEYIISFPEYERPINAICGLLTWLKFLYFFRIYKQTGHFITMLTQVLTDMKVFMSVFTITLLAFAQAFLLLSNNNVACEENPHFTEDNGLPELLNGDACSDGENPN
jgi:hypothetical protein